MPTQEIGAPIPDVPHAISVSLPTWEATVGYEEDENWVVSKMNSGYPRFFIHSTIKKLAKKLEEKYGRQNESAFIFPSYKVAKRCREFVKAHAGAEASGSAIRILQLSTPPPANEDERSTKIESNIGVVFLQTSLFPVAKSYWQHSGEGISSRMGEYVLRELFGEQGDDGNHDLSASEQAKQIQKKSPSISASFSSLTNPDQVAEKEYNAFVEQKFGRVLDLKFAKHAKIALRRRICGKVDKSHNQQEEIEKSKRGKNLSETDVYLFPTGMASIFYAHYALLQVWDKPKKSVCFGFPYVDTLNILKKFGPGVHFLGLGDDASLDELERQLENGEIDVMALFCECPSNPLLKTPNLRRIRSLADKYNFAVVVDETVGNFLNIHVLPFADMVASSLTKVFSGDSNVMGGSLILNPLGKHYQTFKKFFDEECEDLLWDEDALYLERNSRDFAERSAKINKNSLLAVDLLEKSPLISRVYYPTLDDTRKYYEDVRTPDGGYGGLLSFLFHNPNHAVRFFNAVNLHKGPSLGTNFTLACPYAILAHYQELDEIAKWDVDRNLIRISIGLEDPEELLAVLKKSLDLAGTP